MVEHGRSVEPPRTPGTHGIDVWHVDLACATDALLALERQVPRLAADDRHRAARQGLGDGDHPSARQRRAVYVALRVVLEGTFGADVRGVEMTRSALGRPSIPGLRGDFSLSHVAGHALIAVAAGGSVGVDIETIRVVRMDARRQGLIARAAVLLGTDAPLPEAAPDGFLSAWVRLEAYAKARHIGMARLLTAIGVTGHSGPLPIDVVARQLRTLGCGDGRVTTDRDPWPAGIGPGGVEVRQVDQQVMQPDVRAPGAEHAAMEPAAVAVHDLGLPRGLFGALAWSGPVTTTSAQPPAVRTMPGDLAGLRTVAPRTTCAHGVISRSTRVPESAPTAAITSRTSTPTSAD